MAGQITAKIGLSVRRRMVCQYGVLSERKDQEIQRMKRGESRSNCIHKDRIGQIYWTE